VTWRPVAALGGVMKNGLLAALVLCVCACGAYWFPGGGPSPTPGTGTVSGRVIAVPCAPVEQADAVCAGRPVPKLEIDYLIGTTVNAMTLTDATGHYAVTLRPRAYTVRMKTYMRVISGPVNLTVGPGSNIVADYVLDTGIRLPVPQQ
jgi:hypothetical protein